MAQLELDELTKVFQDGNDEVVAVDGVSIDIPDGEFLVVVGPSGCGKSTTLRMVAGLESVTDGEIRLGGRVLNDVKPQNRDIAMVFQSYALYPHMSVRGNMSFGLEESTDLPDAEIDQRVEDAADMMGIEDLLDRKPGELSGGQRQRVALGRAIVRDPEVFLMDEPLSNLDAKLRSQMRTELQRIQEDLGVTTMYVTHDQTEAMTMGDRIAILNDGRLQQVATPLECYHEPANQFVAGFIGEPSMNFFDVDRSGDRLVGDAFEYPLTDHISADIGDVSELVLGVRPESVELVGEATGRHDFETTVDVVEPMGNENTVYLDFDADATNQLVATTDGMHRIEEGDRVAARIPDDAIHVFDRATGEALHNRSIAEEPVPDPPAE
ncbi:ABC transporter ATP-binding protein [Halosimplex sp. J119]